MLAYVRIYAFASLASRKHNGLFQVLVENLGDTTEIDFYTEPIRQLCYPADLMLWSVRGDFSELQMDSIKKLVVKKYSHLNTLEYALHFHKPSDDQYEYVRAIVMKDITRRSALVALSKYRREQDVELIKSGFKFDHDPWGNYSFYQAIENFPHKGFEQQLLAAYKHKIYRFGLGYDKQFINALAMYKSNQSLRVLEKYAHQFMDSHYRDMKPSEKTTSLSIIYQALKNHYTPMYDELINEITKKTGGQIEVEEEL